MEQLARGGLVAVHLLADLVVRETDDARQRDDLPMLRRELLERLLDARLLLVQDRLLARRAEGRVVMEQVVAAALIPARRRVERDLLGERALVPLPVARAVDDLTMAEWALEEYMGKGNQ